ncbi:MULTISPECIES: hypothetical protein [Shewanella]|uniref:Uncharacterized protein n=2 Tax=Shewanella TaxID=22 RepID=A0A974XP65_9GAMM|nr:MULTISPECIES: hypothetical protein [Shewanella]QSX31986.1 hypothetical protein JYB88_13855 [Shewanella cyperi]QSX39207.1 hypothetical protein JYB85_14190 [Shewanella sedimentimangrovi]QSX42750.1 hypothetical protein JYB84_13785 [Shewanella cyperi]
MSNKNNSLGKGLNFNQVVSQFVLFCDRNEQTKYTGHCFKRSQDNLGNAQLVNQSGMAACVNGVAVCTVGTGFL